MRVSFDVMVAELRRVLQKQGFSAQKAEESATMIAQNSLDGIYSHGLNRFPRVVSYIEKGYIHPEAQAACVASMGSFEQWDGNLGMGNLNAKMCMNRAITLAKDNGIGLVALRNNNHWLRGGTYGWQAAEAGCVGMCWTNTQPNMPAWGATDCRIGNNPFIMALPRLDGNHVVVDCALAQFSYGKMEATRLAGAQLPMVGGYDVHGNLTANPAEIEQSGRVLPIGYWKGSGFSIALDLIGAVLSGGKSTYEISKLGADEYALSQVFIAIDPTKFALASDIDATITDTLNFLHDSHPAQENGSVTYPGERSVQTRQDNLAHGIPVVEEIWAQICAM